MSATVSAPDGAALPAAPPQPQPRPAAYRHLEVLAGPLLMLGLAIAFTLIALEGDGGLQLGRDAPIGIGVLLGSGLLCAGAIVAGRPARRPWGMLPLALFGLFVVLTGISVIWAIDPSTAWIEANRTLMRFAVFAGGIALVRLAPGRWRALIGAVLLATVAVSLYALLTKIFPGGLAADETYGRLREPFQYWNSVGLMAALGLPAAVWLGARREGHAGLAALAYPAIGLLTLAILMAYSRGALLAAILGLGVWFAVVPLRLRAAVVLIPSVALGALAGFWTFHQEGLSEDRIPLPIRSNAGTELGVLLVVLVVALLLIGLWATWMRDRRTWPEPARRTAGAALLIALALLPVLAAGALAMSDRGLGGSVSHAWRNLTDPNANTPANDPSRLTAIGSVRARYWRDAITIFDARPVLGVGAGGYEAARLRVRKDDLDVLHAHGDLVQTAADLGIVGLALTLALLAAWLASTVKTTGRWRGRGARPPAEERLGMLTLATVVVVFGVHSLIDWTWYVPGNVVPALLCAGWVAGRGPTAELLPALGGARARLRSGARDAPRVVAAVVVAITAAWSTAQPLRAENQVDAALEQLAEGRPAAARALAAKARRTNPLSVEPLYALATIEATAGRPAAARAALERAVRLQPATAEAWVRLAQFDLAAGRPKVALSEIRPALYLDPRSNVARTVFLEAYRAAAAAT